jgi:hypothetical protein
MNFAKLIFFLDHSCESDSNSAQFLSPIADQYRKLKLVQSNKQTDLPLFHSVEQMIQIEEMNLLGLVHNAAVQLWSTAELIRYLVAKKILDPKRTDVKFQTKSAK